MHDDEGRSRGAYMSSLVRFLGVIIVCFFSAVSFAQTYPYRLQASFNLPNIDTLNAPTTNLITFSLEWRETGKEITGRYQDNFISVPIPVLGALGPSGRTFTIVYPNGSQGIKTIEIFTSANASEGRPAALSITSKAEIGAVIGVMNVLGSMSSSVNDKFCSLGFGVLTGYCGTYSGNTQEASDSANLCQLNVMKNLSLQVHPSTEVSIIVNDVPMSLGSLPLSPMTTRIQMNARNCGAHVNTNFNPAHCQTMSLQGEFFAVGDARNFSGAYTIRDETTGESCTYGMAVDARNP
jgi:hypothetical protein